MEEDKFNSVVKGEMQQNKAVAFCAIHPGACMPYQQSYLQRVQQVSAHTGVIHYFGFKFFCVDVQKTWAKVSTKVICILIST